MRMCAAKSATHNSPSSQRKEFPTRCATICVYIDVCVYGDLYSYDNPIIEGVFLYVYVCIVSVVGACVLA